VVVYGIEAMIIKDIRDADAALKRSRNKPPADE
jgi:hypothetical protein